MLPSLASTTLPAFLQFPNSNSISLEVVKLRARLVRGEIFSIGSGNEMFNLLCKKIIFHLKLNRTLDFTFNYTHLIVLLLLTITGSNTLTSCRECQCFSHCKFSDMKIMLAYICWCSLRDKFIHFVPVVSYSPRYLQFLFKFISKYNVALVFLSEFELWI